MNTVELHTENVDYLFMLAVFDTNDDMIVSIGYILEVFDWCYWRNY